MAEKAARVKALYHDAELAGKLDEFERMKSSAELSLALAQESSDKWDIAIAKFYAGLALHHRDDFEHALPLMQQSLAEFRELGDPYWESCSQRNLSGLLVNRGKLSFIESTLQNLDLARRAGERLNLAEALLDFYWLYADESGEPRKYAEEADILFQQIGSNMSWTAFEFAEIAWLKGDYQQART